MAQHIHIDDDLEAMAITCWSAFIAPEQESSLVELLKYREHPDNLSFIREFGPPDLDADQPCGKAEEVPECGEV